MKGYIYITTNLIDNKKYIGKRVDTKFREWYLGSGIYLRNAVNKYGKENFKVEKICEADNLEILDKLEIEYIKKYDAVNSNEFYNIHPGGTGFMWGECSHMKKPEYKKMFSEMLSGEKTLCISLEKGEYIQKGLKGINIMKKLEKFNHRQ